jgi:integrase/recombinase XerD
LKGETTSLSSPNYELIHSGMAMAAYQFVREPVRPEEGDRLCHACQSTDEKLIVWTLLDTGLRVSERCSLTPEHVLWQQKSLRVSGKGGPYGKRSKKRVVPLSRRIQALLEPYFALNEKGSSGRARRRRSSSAWPSAPGFPRA